MELNGIFGRVLAKAIRSMRRLWNTELQLRTRGDKVRVDLVVPEIRAGSSIDQRIAQIDQAKASLTEALSAIHELKASAEQNKVELGEALDRIQAVRQDKAAAEKELGEVKQIAQADIEVFKKLAGVPSRNDITRERCLGFILGVLASLLASLIWWLFTR